jgi:hypothetical protein
MGTSTQGVVALALGFYEVSPLGSGVYRPEEYILTLTPMGETPARRLFQGNRQLETALQGDNALEVLGLGEEIEGLNALDDVTGIHQWG